MLKNAPRRVVLLDMVVSFQGARKLDWAESRARRRLPLSTSLNGVVLGVAWRTPDCPSLSRLEGARIIAPNLRELS